MPGPGDRGEGVAEDLTLSRFVALSRDITGSCPFRHLFRKRQSVEELWRRSLSSGLSIKQDRSEEG